MQQISRRFYLVSWLAGSIVSFVLFAFGGALVAADPASPAGIAAMICAFALLIYILVVWLIFTYKLWSHLPPENARTTPGKALGFLFIPFFNFYWLFQAYWGWARDYNSLAEKRGLEIRRMPAGLALAMCIMDIVNIPLSLVPGLNILSQAAAIVLTALFISNACRGINTLAELPTEQLRHAEQEAAAVKSGEFHADDPAAAPEGTPGMVIAGFILGILGLVFSIFTAIPGLILGIIGLSKISMSAGRLRGKGLAIAAIVLSGFSLTGALILTAMLMPSLARARGEARKASCFSNLKQVGLTLAMYANDNRNLMPTGRTAGEIFQKLEEEGYLENRNLLICPGNPIDRVDFNDPEGISYYIDPAIPRARHALRAIAADSPPWEVNHGDGVNVLFADFHVKFIRPGDSGPPDKISNPYIDEDTDIFADTGDPSSHAWIRWER